MRHTENPLTYTFAQPRAKFLLYHLEGGGQPVPYEALRQEMGLGSQTFHRLTRRLAQFDLVRLRAPQGAEFEDGRIRLVVELAPRGEQIASVLHDLDQEITKHASKLGKDVVEDLRAPA